MFLKGFLAKRRLNKVRNKIHAIFNDCDSLEVGYITIFITSYAWDDDGSCSIKHTLINENLNCVPTQVKIQDISSHLNELREMVITQAKEYGFTDSVFRGEDDTFYVACPSTGFRQDGLDVMECMLWLPESGPFRPMKIMNKIRSEMPSLWNIALS